MRWAVAVAIAAGALTACGQAGQPVAYLALGDSYTIGEGVGVSDRWPVLLADALRKDGLGVEAPLIVARTGWTPTELARGIETEALEGTFEL